MMNNINIKVTTDEGYANMKKNIKYYYLNFIDYPDNPSWIYNKLGENIFIEKKYTIKDIDLDIPEQGKRLDFENHIKLYENLKDLPKYILSDHKFWFWLMVEKYYKVNLAMMENKKPSSFEYYWTFKYGQRIGLVRTQLSGCFYLVDLTVDESLDDKYELTRFALENQERYRYYSWKSIASNRHVLKSVLKAEKDILNDYGMEYDKSNYYTELTKDLIRLGSTKLIDAMNEDDLYCYMYLKFEEKILKKIDENKE